MTLIPKTRKKAKSAKAKRKPEKEPCECPMHKPRIQSFLFDEAAPRGPELVSSAEFEAAMLAQMERVGIQPQIMFAFLRCGYTVSDCTKDLLPEYAVRRWDAAVDEFLAMHAANRRAVH
jgi:hypothetical protein